MYKPHEIEQKWQKKWEEQSKASKKDAGKKLYVLDMFPYPSSDGLHLGHVRIYTASDIVARKDRMDGFAVLHPTGWDAFGLPAENYAIKTGTHPRITTEKNIHNIKRQMKALGFSYDWDREVNTTDPQYYKWTQWIFLQLFKKGLAYEADIPINWCPKDKTGLANEEVINGRCDRCGTEVKRKQMRQWVLKITDYAERLLQDLDGLDWPEKIKLMQRNWIGASQGAKVRFLLAEKPDEFIEVFTTRPDTLFGATYVVLAPEHALAHQFTDTSHKSEVNAYIEKASKKSDLERTELQKEKTGVFTGGYVINPANGAKLPVWVADYVLARYGTGAIMAVPAHDERDWQFAKKHDLSVVPVITKDKGRTPHTSGAFVGEGYLINSDTYNGLSTNDARENIVNDLQKKGLAESTVQYKLRDWVFSRQRYWGEPIPIIHCPTCGAVPVPEDQLPVVLPELDDFQPTGTGESPLAKIQSWVTVECPNCHGPAKRETDTMPQWAGSSWYYLRFIDPHNNEKFADFDKLVRSLPVDCYLGGAEHAVLHLLYARFWHKFLYDQKLAPTPEPFQQLKSVGTVLANAYKDSQGRYVHFSDVVIDGDMAFHKETGEVLTPETEKMSKSKGNVISPDSLIEKYGADCLRLAVMFMAPWDQMTSFNVAVMEGTSHLLRKIDSLLDKKQTESDDKRVAHSLEKVTDQITKDIERFHFNTAVSSLMIITNELSDQSVVKKTHLERLTLLLAPFAPHFAEEMWERLGHTDSVLSQKWPETSQEKIRDEEVEIVVQINGKVRGTFTALVGLSENELIEKALAQENVKKYLTGSVIKKIVVPNKLVNFVVG